MKNTLIISLLIAAMVMPAAAQEERSQARMSEARAMDQAHRSSQALAAQGLPLWREAQGPRIIRGDDVDQRDQDWAWTVSIRLDGKHRCGGSLIARSENGWAGDETNPEWVLTAAHCVFDQNKTLIKEERLQIGSGHVIRTSQLTQKVLKIIPHEGFNEKTLENDIALLKIKKADVEGDFKRTSIRLPTSTEMKWLAAPYTATSVYGWGVTEHGGIADVLQIIRLPVVDRRTCLAGFQDTGTTETLPSTVICAGFTSGSLDSCQGDSGGPLAFLPGRIGTDLVKSTVLVGIVSWGRGCAEPGVAGVYTSVRPFLNWIESKIPRT